MRTDGTTKQGESNPRYSPQLNDQIVPQGRALALRWEDVDLVRGRLLVRRAVKAVQELLGHSTIETTMRYAHLSPDVRRDAVRLLDVDPPDNTGGVGS